jgi:ATP-binding cassette, subfamily B, bacterial CvaB/MchF/RaxB
MRETSTEREPWSLLKFGKRNRLPVIFQTEAAECGLACLAMISGYYEHEVDLLSLRLKFSTSIKGVTLARLIEMAHEMNFTTRAIRIEVDDIGGLETPCILHWGMDHFVVLKRVTRSGVVIHDPAYGERHVSYDELSKRFTGVVLELWKGLEFRKSSPEPTVSLRDLAGNVTGLYGSLLKIFAMATALELFSLVTPQFMQIVTDQVLADNDHDLLTFLGVSFTLLLVVQTAVTAMRTWAVIWISSQFNIGWSANVFRQMLGLSHQYFLKRHLGDLISRFGAINAIQQTFTTQSVEAILDGLMASLTFALLVVYSGPMAAITLVATIIYIGLRFLYFRIFKEANLNQIVTMARQQGVLMETIRGIQTVQLHNKQAARSSKFMNLTAEVLNNSIIVQRLQMMFDASSGITTGLQRVSVIWLAAWFTLKGSFTAGMLIAFAAYADQFSTRANSFIDYLIKLRLLRLQTERLADIVLSPQEQGLESGYLGEVPHALTLSFKGVSFRYSEGDPWVLEECSFEIHEGESVAIVGPSGCGKSTLAKLITGLLDPNEGRIELSGVDIRKFGKNAVRSMIGSVMQDDALFNGTVADNICFFDQEAVFSDIRYASELAGIHQEIMQMPMGYQSLIGDMGSSLSGGQRQRLLLARALYRKPKLLLLDEATSHLDIANERAINTHIRHMRIMRIVIAHRPETIRSCDRVIELHERKARYTDFVDQSQVVLADAMQAH